MKTSPLIVLLTDFGSSDAFAGILKGVITRISPAISMLDLTHEIPPGDVRRAAITLWQALPYFPKNTVFLCVVDPGVGTSRRALLVRSSGYSFVGPDNGLFSFVLADDHQARELRNPELALSNPSSTFHGRDIFAPAAAHLARGVPAEEFGPQATGLVRLTPPRLSSPSAGVLIGEVLHADRFGNLLTSLGRFDYSADGEFLLFSPWLPGLSEARFSPRGSWLRLPGEVDLAWASTFADIPPGSCAVALGSSGLLEIVANRRSASELLGINGGESIILFNMEIVNG